MSKACTGCGETKPLHDFYVTTRARDGKTSRCKPCIDRGQAARYAGNREEMRSHRRTYNALHGARINAQRRAREQSRRDVLDGIKAEHGCRECGEDDPCCLHWHHRDPRLKAFAISDAIREMRIPMDAILEEIKKCDVLCANHHLKLHAGNKGANGVAA